MTTQNPITLNMVQLAPTDTIGSSTLNTIFFNLYQYASCVVAACSIRGPKGDQGLPGNDGADGIGIPPEGTQGQVLTKASSRSYDTVWAEAPGYRSDQVLGVTGGVGYVLVKTGFGGYCASFVPISQLTGGASTHGVKVLSNGQVQLQSTFDPSTQLATVCSGYTAWADGI